MWQVWSVSANTAAYASESVKRPERAPRKIEIEQAAKELARANNPDATSHIFSTVAAAAPSLYLSTSGRQNPQATLEEALGAYGENEGSEE